MIGLPKSYRNGIFYAAMPRFSKESLDKLSSCDWRLIRVFNEVIQHVDCTILEGHRTPERQAKLVAEGKSKTLNSKHLSDPSMAVDVAPFPIDWDDEERFILFAGFVLGLAKSMKIELTWGGNWKGDFDIKNNGFRDLVHFQLRQS